MSSKVIFTDASAPSAPGSGKTAIYAVSGVPHFRAGASGIDTALVGGLILAAATPSDPVGTSDTTGKMAGLALTFTPATTGRIAIIVSGNLTNSTAAAGDGAKCQIRYGTGSAPANADALTGTTIGNIVTSVLERATASDLQGFCCIGVFLSATIGTTYWCDLSEAAVAGGTGQIKNISMLVLEG